MALLASAKSLGPTRRKGRKMTIFGFITLMEASFRTLERPNTAMLLPEGSAFATDSTAATAAGEIVKDSSFLKESLREEIRVVIF